MLNDVKFKEYMTLMSEIFNKELSNITRDVYWTALKQFNDDNCIKAFKVAISTLKWFPKPSELIDIIKKFENELPALTKAENQLEFALQWIRECSNVPNPIFKDPVTHHIMTTRWPQSVMIHSAIKDITWFKKEFKEAYIAYEQEQSVLKLENQEVKKLISNIGVKKKKAATGRIRKKKRWRSKNQSAGWMSRMTESPFEVLAGINR